MNATLRWLNDHPQFLAEMYNDRNKKHILQKIIPVCKPHKSQCEMNTCAISACAKI